MIKLTSILNEESPCWKGYRQIGMKTKNGKEVPNCVPINDSVNEYIMPHDVDSKMKELGISKIPISSQGERILKGMVKEKFLDKITNKERLIYFYQSLGDARFGYGIKGKPLSPLVDKFTNDLMSDSISFGGKLAAYQVAMTIKDMKVNDEEIESPYEMMKEYFKNFGMKYNRNRVFDSAIRNLEDWMKRNKIQESVNEANAVSGGKVHKFITGKNLTLKGKKYSDIEFEVKGIDNSNQLVNLKVLFPKNIFGQEIKVPFKTIRRGPFIKTDTSKINEASIDKASQTYFKLVDVVKGLEDNQKTLFGAYKQAQKRGDNEYMVKALDSMKGNQQKLNKARKELERAEKEYFSSVSSTHRSLELDYED